MFILQKTADQPPLKTCESQSDSLGSNGTSAATSECDGAEPETTPCALSDTPRLSGGQPENGTCDAEAPAETARKGTSTCQASKCGLELKQMVMVNKKKFPCMHVHMNHYCCNMMYL